MNNEFKKVLCDKPFRQVTVDRNGDVNFCCPDWNGFYSLGNLNEKSFSEIWFGDRAKQFRNQFFENKYDICKLDLCIKGQSMNVPVCGFDKKPHTVIFNYDSVCNQRCIFCRDCQIKNIDTPTFLSEDKMDTLLDDILENAKIVFPSTAGECFFSPQSKDLIKKISSKFPNIKFSILTNGLLASPKMLEELAITNKISQMIVSLHAVHSWTYNKMVVGGNFRKVMDNVRYFSKLRKEGKIQEFHLNFVVNAYNYKEMPAFVKMAEKLGAKASFLELLDTGIDKKMYDKLNIFSENHPEYKKFIKMLANPIFKSENCIMNEFLAKFHK